jgi:hypothetical protein
LSKLEWKEQTQQPNSTDGILYGKTGRNVRIIPISNKKDQTVDIHVYVTEFNLVKKNADGTGPQYVGNIGELIKMPKGIAEDIPQYPNAERKMSRHPGMWYEYRTKDSVDSISNWYSDQMKKNGWEVVLDTSELGDTYRIFGKEDAKGNKRKVGVRVNNMQKEQERWLTLVMLPDNAVVPPVVAPSKLQGKDGSAATSVEEAIKKARGEGFKKGK